ncbi:hypothetical protein SCUCBS95973_007579 [Sporothrix curviconia]|uniref:Cytochrome b5 heme-binding domain-containing protein n=1 Tax=Sporothrix curviconia TaxID=1260050 RepID=A0ABP0CET8_9PEZI
MAAFESTARQRKLNLEPRVVDVTDMTDEEEDKPSPPLAKTMPARKSKKRPRIEEEDDYSPYLDVFRVLTFLLMASCGLSYLVSGGESYFWGMKHRPDYLKLSWWKMQYNGPQYFTLEELAGYDGTDASKPIYLSIDGNVFDVTAGRNYYGPAGSYRYFAGVDASRGFVTGCFADDRTGDLRGVEDMFLPIDNPEIDSHWTPAELEKKKAEEVAEAKKRVRDSVQHWVDFFHKSHKYQFVGKLVREPGWEGELKPLCKVAQDGRTYREIPSAENA